VSGADGDRLQVALRWAEAAPDRIVASVSLRGSPSVPLPDLAALRKALQERRFGALGEVSAQYAGLSLSDPEFEPYLALAEELDVPVAVHTGISFPGVSYAPCCRNFRTALGNPVQVEEALNRHPKLRLSLMHAGWPYLQDTIAIMSVYPQVYADLAVIDWIIPRAEFHDYLRALLRAGFGKRLMFGSDQMQWPEAIGMAVEGIESARFLTREQKRDIFYNNAVRFFRLQP
jgi:predicted TIM-barrel fold metal-dependent hydrolase